MRVARLGSMGYGNVTRVAGKFVWVMVGPMMNAKCKRSEVVKVAAEPAAGLALQLALPGQAAGGADAGEAQGEAQGEAPAAYQELMSEVGAAVLGAAVLGAAVLCGAVRRCAARRHRGQAALR